MSNSARRSLTAERFLTAPKDIDVIGVRSGLLQRGDKPRWRPAA